MPDLKTHCRISKERTGETFEDLHKWMDEASAFLGMDHRFERHSNAYMPYVKEKWGKKGIQEFLYHIIKDFEETLKAYEGVCESCGNDTWKGKKLCIKCYREKKK